MNICSIYKDIIMSRKKGLAKGICSICTANMFVLEAVLKKRLRDNLPVLIESTSNQVNQYGGYTGLKPKDFKAYIYKISKKIGFPTERIILGGDHLGPNPWKNEKATLAMEKANKLIEDYISAGYKKIHIDTSMYLADDYLGDRIRPLDTFLIAERGADLIFKAEHSYRKLQKECKEAEPPVYVIGTEVPIPGGTSSNKNRIEVTTLLDLKETLYQYKNSLKKRGIEDVWRRVIAVVVQPGVEFGGSYIMDYEREKAMELSKFLNNYQNLVFEAHSTDYQRAFSLKQLVEDGFCILKVGPALTFALREALFAMEYIEKELFADNKIELSNLQATLDAEMMKNPVYWHNYYHGNERELKLARRYSLSDRSRYYWTVPAVKSCVNRLINNLKYVKVPLTLISQFIPEQYDKIRNGLLENEPLLLIEDRVVNVIDKYDKATNPVRIG